MEQPNLFYLLNKFYYMSVHFIDSIYDGLPVLDVVAAAVEHGELSVLSAEQVVSQMLPKGVYMSPYFRQVPMYSVHCEKYIFFILVIWIRVL